MTQPSTTRSRDNVLPFRATPAIGIASVQGALALELQPRHDPPPLEGAPARRGGDVTPVGELRRRGVEQWSRRYAQAVVEIVGGDRPVAQLVRWTDAQVFADLDRRAQLVARAGGYRPGTARVQPVRPKVAGVRTCFLTPEIVEASVHVRYGERSRAVAARFELKAERWICTALEFA